MREVREKANRQPGSDGDGLHNARPRRRWDDARQLESRSPKKRVVFGGRPLAATEQYEHVQVQPLP